MGTVLIVLFGILLPAIALVVELNTGMCAETFFDPISTLGHVALVALVPVANLLALIVTWGGWVRWRTPLLWLNGVALGVAFDHNAEQWHAISIIGLISVQIFFPRSWRHHRRLTQNQKIRVH